MKASLAFLIFTICFHASANIGSSQGDGNSSQLSGGNNTFYMYPVYENISHRQAYRINRCDVISCYS